MLRPENKRVSRRIAFLFLLLASTVQPSAIAQQICTSLLNNGVFDQSNTVTIFSEYSHIRSVLCSSSYSSETAAKTNNTNAGFSYDEILASFGYSSGETSYREARLAFCSQNESQLHLDSHLEQSLSKADGDLANAFSQCVTKYSGIEYYVIKHSDTAFTIRSIFRANTDDAPPKVKNLSIEPASIKNNCQGLDRFKPGRILGIDEQITCSKQAGEDVTVALSTTVLSSSDPAFIRARVNETIVQNDSLVYGNTVSVVATNHNRWGEPSCVYADLNGHHWTFDTQTDDYEVLYNHDNIYSPPQPPFKETSLLDSKHFCGRMATRPGSDSATSWTTYRVKILAHEIILQTSSPPIVAQPVKSKVITRDQLRQSMF